MLNNKKKLNINDFFKLPIKKQEEIMSKIGSKANKDQLDLVKRYDELVKKTSVHCA